MRRLIAAAALAACSSAAPPPPPAPVKLSDPCSGPAALLGAHVVVASIRADQRPPASGYAGGDIDRVIRANRGRFRACYMRGRLRAPEIGGRLIAQIHIAPSGCVAAVEIHAGFDDGVDACLVRVLRSLEFSRRDAWELVRYPMIFD